MNTGRKRPLVSVIITSYNYDRFLAQAVESALEQTYPETEVIVVDDGSTDDSRSVIAAYEGQVKALLKDNGGQASAINFGFAKSRGDVVIFVDSDDALLPMAAERAVERFSGMPIARVQWPLLEIDEDGCRTGRAWPPHALRDGDLLDDLVQNGLVEHDWPPTSGNAWSRSLLTRLLPMPEAEYRTSPDIYLALLTRLYGSIASIEEPLALYRVHGDNASGGIFFEEELRRIDISLSFAADELRKQGINVDIDAWKEQSWPHKVDRARWELAGLIERGDQFVLVDEEELWAVIEHEWELYRLYPDENEESMIHELERLRANGASFFVLAWPAFWWLECYLAFYSHLRDQYVCILENKRMVVFDLRVL